MSALGPGCVRTPEDNALAQQSNRMNGQRKTLLRPVGSTRINLASKWPEICFRTAWVMCGRLPFWRFLKPPWHIAMPTVEPSTASKDAMKPEDAASSSFDCFNIDQKERDAMTRSATVTTGEHTLYAALELSKNSWLLAIRPGSVAVIAVVIASWMANISSRSRS